MIHVCNLWKQEQAESSADGPEWDFSYERKELERFSSDWNGTVWSWTIWIHSLMPPKPLFFRWTAFVCGSLPQINTPLVLFSLLSSSHVPCPQQHFPSFCPLSACWLPGKLPKGQTVPKWRAEMAGWSPQTAAQLLSPPALQAPRTETQTQDKTDERTASWGDGELTWLSLPVWSEVAHLSVFFSFSG